MSLPPCQRSPSSGWVERRAPCSIFGLAPRTSCCPQMMRLVGPPSSPLASSLAAKFGDPMWHPAPFSR
eukprot:7790860-Alexandrium_andersonii.AAC.1